MAQVVFSGSTGTITNLNANFTQLYDLREYVTTPGYTGATPKLTLSANYNWTFAAATSGITATISGQTKIGTGAASNTSTLMVNNPNATATGLQLFQDSQESWIMGMAASAALLSWAASGTSRMTLSNAGLLSVLHASADVPVIDGVGTGVMVQSRDTGAAGAVTRIRATNTVNTLDFTWSVSAVPASIRIGGVEAIGISTVRGVSMAAPSSGATLAVTGIANGTIFSVTDATRTVVVGTDTANGTAYVGTSTAHPLDLWQGGSAKVRIQTTGNLESIANGLIGYGAGSGGTVTQATSKSTGVTLNKASGQITMNAASLAATTSVNFTLTNSTIGANDVVNVAIKSGATAGSYLVQVDATAAGSCSICLRNYSGGALAEAVVLNFAVLKASVS